MGAVGGAIGGVIDDVADVIESYDVPDKLYNKAE